MTKTSPFTPNRLAPWRVQAVTVESFRRHTAQVYSVDIQFAGPIDTDRYKFSPGQFNMLYVPGIGEAAISIAGRSESGLIRHTIRAVGAVTHAIEAGGQGMAIGLRGPFGHGWPLTQPHDPDGRSWAAQDIVLVAGGIGLAPLRSMVEHIVAHRDRYRQVNLLVGARTPEDLLYVEDFSAWRAMGIDVQTIVDRATDDWKGKIGLVTVLVDHLSILKPSQTTVMTCGPEKMMKGVAEAAVKRGISPAHIYLALERNMSCAVGLCGHCQLGPDFICKDGPVLAYGSVKDRLRIRDL